jgi:photosystem II stability/assembly factor-like uncharacterized protein
MKNILVFIYLLLVSNLYSQVPEVTDNSLLKFEEGNNSFKKTVGDLGEEIRDDLSYKVTDEIIHVKDFQDPGEEPIEYFEQAVLAATENSTLYLPKGKFNLQRTWRINKALQIVGEGTTGTILYFPKDSSGIVLIGGSLNKYITLKGLRIESKLKIATDVEGTYVAPLNDDPEQKGVGLNIRSRAIVKDVYVTGFKGHGWMINSKVEGVQYSEQESTVDVTLNGVYMNSGTLGWAVGNNATVLKTSNGTDWIPKFPNTSVNLKKVYSSGANNVWTIGDVGNIHSSTDGGETWAINTSGVTENLNGVHFTNGTSGYVVGNNKTILRTTNGDQGAGTTWTDASGDAPNVDYYDVWQYSAGLVFAIGENGTFIQSTNNGVNWTNVQVTLDGDPDTITADLKDIMFKTTTGPTYGFIVGNQGTFIRSKDNGVTWQHISTSITENLQAISFGNRNRGRIVTALSRIYVTADEGDTWGIDPSYIYDQVMNSIWFTGTSVGWVVGDEGKIYKAAAADANINNWVIESGWSVGNGRSGLYVVGSDVNAGNLTFFDARNNGQFGLYDNSFLGNAYEMVHTNNNGQSSVVTWPPGGNRWYAILRESGGAYLDSIPKNMEPGITSGFETYWDTLPSSKNGKLFTFGNTGKFIVTEDAGLTWTEYSTGITDNILGFGSQGNSRVLAVGVGGVIIKSTNGGTSWTSEISGTVQDLSDLDMVTGNIGWAVGNAGTILKTTDFGENWTAQTSGTAQNLNDVYMLCTTSGYAVGNSGTIRRMTGTVSNNTWGNVTSITPSTSENLNAIHICQPFLTTTNNCSLTAGFAAGENGTILKTTNGADWTVTTYEPTFDYNDIHSTFGNYVIACGNDGALVRSTNGGTSWSTITLSAPYDTYDWYSVQFLGDKWCYLVGQNNTILFSQDYGATWALQTNPVSGGRWNSIELNTQNLNGKNPGWDASTQYFAGGAVALPGATNTSVVLGLYAENNQPPSFLGPQTSVLGGLTGAYDDRSLGFSLRHDTNGKLIFEKGFKIQTPVGSTSSTINFQNDEIEMTVGGTTAINGLKWTYDNDGNISFENSTSPVFKTTTALNTDIEAGTGAPIAQGNIVFPKGFYFGNSSTNVRKMTNATTKPSFTALGDITWNRNPAVNEPMFWFSGTGSVVYDGPKLGIPYYDRIKYNGSAVTRRSDINFNSSSTIQYTIADDAGNSETDVTPNIVAGSIGTTELANSGVVAGTYSYPTVTVDAKGRATSISSNTITMIEDVKSFLLAGRSVQFTSGATNNIADFAYVVEPKYNDWYIRDVSAANVIKGDGTGGSANTTKIQIIRSGLDTTRFARCWLGNVGYFTNTNVCVQVKTGDVINMYLDTVQTGGTVPKGFNMSLYMTQSSCTPTDALDLVHSTQYASVINYATTQGYTKPSVAQQVAQNTLVKTLVDAGIWSKLDVFHITTRGSEEFSKINWKTPGTANLTETGTVTWSAGTGFTGNGSGSDDYLSSFDPSTGTWNYTQNSATFGIWATADVDNNRIVACSNTSGNRTLMILSSNSTYRCNSTAATAATFNFDGTGFTAINRSSSSDLQTYKNATNASTTTTSSGVNQTFTLLRDLATGTDSDSSIGAWFAGSSLTSGEYTTLYNALTTYFSIVSP